MNKFSKKSAFGIATVGAAAALVAGFAAPAMASTTHASHDSSYSSNSNSTTSSTNKEMTSAQAWADALRNVNVGTGTVSNWSPVVVSPSLNAPISTGDIGSGNALLSGNEVPVLSGNDVQAPLLSGNDTAIGNNDGGNAIGSGDLTGNINTSVSNLVNSLTKDVGNSSSTSTSTTGIVDSILGGR